MSESEDKQNKPHLTVDFKEQRGWELVLEFVQMWCSSNSGSLVAFLDYFWLEANYFKNRYGSDWYSYKAESLLQAGVSKVFLPHSKELAHTLLEVNAGIRLRYRNRTLLSDATARTSLPPDRGNNATHFARLLQPPFLLFERCYTFEVNHTIITIPTFNSNLLVFKYKMKFL